LTDKHQK